MRPPARCGVGDPGSPLAMLVGSGEPFDAATLAALYKGGKPDYLRRFEPSLNDTIAAGYLMAEDHDEILQVASLNYPAAT